MIDKRQGKESDNTTSASREWLTQRQGSGLGIQEHYRLSIFVKVVDPRTPPMVVKGQGSESGFYKLSLFVRVVDLRTPPMSCHWVSHFRFSPAGHEGPTGDAKECEWRYEERRGTDVDAERAARRERRRERASRRKTLESTTTGGDQPSDTVNITDADLLQKPRDSEPSLSRTESNLARTNSVSSTEGFLGGDTSLRVVSPPPSVISDMDSTTTTPARKLTSPIKFEPGSGSTTARESRLRSPESSQVSQTVKSPESTRESRVKSPDTVGSPPVRSPLSSRSQSRESGLCSPERPPSHPASRPRTPEHSTPARSRSPERVSTLHLQTPVSTLHLQTSVSWHR